MATATAYTCARSFSPFAYLVIGKLRSCTRSRTVHEPWGYSLLEKWIPPAGCAEVQIFGDNEGNFAGQKAAHELANKLPKAGIKVRVHNPDIPATDWDHGRKPVGSIARGCDLLTIESANLG
jgi:hypothetical protein